VIFAAVIGRGYWTLLMGIEGVGGVGGGVMVAATFLLGGRGFSPLGSPADVRRCNYNSCPLDIDIYR